MTDQSQQNQQSQAMPEHGQPLKNPFVPPADAQPASQDNQQPYIDPAAQSAQSDNQQPVQGFAQGQSQQSSGQEGTQATAEGQAMENPFVPPNSPSSPPAGIAFKKILAVIVLIVAVLAVLFFIFSIIRRVMKKSEKVSLTYWGLWEEAAVMQPIIDRYESDHSNVTISYIKESPRQYRERLQASIVKGTGPDVFRFHNTWVPMLRQGLAPAPESSLKVSEFEKSFYPVAVSDLVIDGKIYGVPLEIDGLGLYYNEELLKAAGVAPPATWEDLQDASKKVTVKDSAGNITTAGIALGTANNIEHFSDIVAVMMMQNGVDLKNPISTEAQDTLSFYRFFAQPPGNVWDEQMDNSIIAFANEKVAMIIAPSWQAHTIAEINPELQFRIIPIPQLPGANISWASYWVEGVSAQSTHQEQAWDFLKFLSSKDALTQLYTEVSNKRAFGEPYSRVDLASSLSDDPLVGAYVQQAPIARSFFLASRTFDNGINDRMIKYLEDAISSLSLGVSPAAAVETMAIGFAQVLSDFGL